VSGGLVRCRHLHLGSVARRCSARLCVSDICSAMSPIESLRLALRRQDKGLAGEALCSTRGAKADACRNTHEHRTIRNMRASTQLSYKDI